MCSSMHEDVIWYRIAFKRDRDTLWVWKQGWWWEESKVGSLNKSPTGCGQTAVGLVPTPRPPPPPSPSKGSKPGLLLVRPLRWTTITSVQHSCQFAETGGRERQERLFSLLNSPESRLVLHSGLLHPKTALMLISKTRISSIFSLKGAKPHSSTHPVVSLLKRIQSTNYIMDVWERAWGVHGHRKPTPSRLPCSSHPHQPAAAPANESALRTLLAGSHLVRAAAGAARQAWR